MLFQLFLPHLGNQQVSPATSIPPEPSGQTELVTRHNPIYLLLHRFTLFTQCCLTSGLHLAWTCKITFRLSPYFQLYICLLIFCLPGRFFNCFFNTQSLNLKQHPKFPQPDFICHSGSCVSSTHHPAPATPLKSSHSIPQNIPARLFLQLTEAAPSAYKAPSLKSITWSITNTSSHFILGGNFLYNLSRLSFQISL